MSHASWYATRGSGAVSLVLLTLVVALGIAGSLRLRSDRWPRFLITGLHRNLTLLTLAFLALHIATTLLDAFTPIGLRDAVVPFLASYRPVWLGLGAVAFDLLLALTVTSLLRARFGHRVWRSFHWLAYAAWPVAVLHGLGTGSDVRLGWLQVLTLGCLLLVGAAIAARVYAAGVEPSRKVAAAAAAGLAAVAGAAWYAQGPGAAGWARRAGTPTALLARPARLLVAHRRVAHQVSPLPSHFRARLDGSIASVVDQSSGLVRVDIRGHATGGVRGLIWVRLQGSPVGDGGVAMSASGVAFGPASAPNLYVGKVTALEGTQLAAAVRNAAGRRLSLRLALNVDAATRHVTGTVIGAAS